MYYFNQNLVQMPAQLQPLYSVLTARRLCKRQAAALSVSMFKMATGRCANINIYGVAVNAAVRTSATCNFLDAMETPLWFKSSFATVKLRSGCFVIHMLKCRRRF